MVTPGIVDAFDNRTRRLWPRPCPMVLRSVRPVFSGREKAFDRSVVPNLAQTAHRIGDAVIGRHLLECTAALFGIMQQDITPASSPDRHYRGIGDEMCSHAGALRREVGRGLF